MTNEIFEDFKNYAYFSVRVDRFFNLANIYGIHYNNLKLIYQSLPSIDVIKSALADSKVDNDLKKFLMVANNNLNYMSTTNIFLDVSEVDSVSIPEDMLNFSFYTCYCFQWTLFENFIKKMIFKAIDEKLIAPCVAEELKKRRKQTKKFLDYINSEKVFGHSPFTTALFVPSADPPYETFDYIELNKIRELRNDFIHGIETPEITSENIIEKQELYERSMWILRKFAENVWQEVQRMKNKQ